MIAVILASIAVAAGVLALVVLLSASSNGGDLPQHFDDMTGMMEGSMMQMQAPEDVMMVFESASEVPVGKQTGVVLKVLDKNSSQTVANAQVIIGIEKGLPMKTMEMQSGMFEARNEGNGTYAFSFTPESEGYYTIHSHVIPQGKHMHSMMENHVDFVLISQ